jgi:hypothetical protein
VRYRGGGGRGERETRSERRTELGDEEEEHEDGGGKRDDAAGEGAAIEVLVHLGVGVQVAELGQEPVHGGRPTGGGCRLDHGGIVGRLAGPVLSCPVPSLPIFGSFFGARLIQKEGMAFSHCSYVSLKLACWRRKCRDFLQ